MQLPEAKNILVIKLRGIGDVLLSVPALRAVRKAYPDARLSFMTEQNGGEVLRGQPMLDEIIVLDRSSGWLEYLRFVREIRKRKFDMVIDLFGNPRTAVLTFMTGARARVGLTWRLRRHAYNIACEGPAQVCYAVEANFHVIRQIGIQALDRTFRLFLGEHDRQPAAEFLKSINAGNKRIVGLNPGGSWQTKQWQAEKFAELAEHLASEYTVLLLGGPAEQKIVEEILKQVRKKVYAVPVMGLRPTAALIENLDLLITVDGALKHIAVAAEIPSITLFGPTNPVAWHPQENPKHRAIFNRDLKCRPCDRRTCAGNECLRSITVENVIDAVREMKNAGIIR